MPLNEFIIAVFCWVETALTAVLKGAYRGLA